MVFYYEYGRSTNRALSKINLIFRIFFDDASIENWILFRGKIFFQSRTTNKVVLDKIKKMFFSLSEINTQFWINK